MTLILASAARHRVVLATDREVTLAGQRFDAYANKAVVYRAPGGLVGLAFTGPAYIAGLPTDQWLVETISGFSFAKTGTPLGFVGLPKLPQWPTIGLALRGISDAFDRACAASPGELRRSHFEIVCVGYTWNRRRFRPVISIFLKGADDPRGRIWHGRRWIQPNSFDIVIAPSANYPFLNVESLRRDLRGIAAPDAIAPRLAASVREVSHRTAFVGGDCMTIEIDPPVPKNPAVRVSFYPATPRLPLGPGAELEPHTSGAFIPWLVAPDLLVAPLLHGGPGTMEFPLAGYTAAIRGTGVIPGAMWFKAQTRPAWPPH